MIDKFIDDLIKGVETKLPVSRHLVDVSFAIQQEYESRQLLSITSLKWSELISNFYDRIHVKISFDDSTRMQCLFSVLERSVEAIGNNGKFYATALKSLKTDIGNPVIVPHLKIQSLLDQPQIKPNNKIGRRHHQEIKTMNT